MGEFKSRGYLSINGCRHNYNITFDLWSYAKYKINIIASLNFLKPTYYYYRSRSNGKDSYRLSTLSFRFSFDIAYCNIYKIHYNEIEQKLSGLDFLVNQKKSQVAPSTTIQRLGFLINKEI
ncbi:hypothetical protein BD770DRAFT_414270 [Pilaira anomala]|nr:hypothetical protein BD770DRAFT_414270 [Pilaira anomala]